MSRRTALKTGVVLILLLGLTVLSLPVWLSARAGQQSPQRVTSTDPALRLKGFEQHQAMKAGSPFKDLKWQFLGPKNVSGRAIDIAVVAPKGKNYTIYVATATGGLWKTDERGDDVGADLRPGTVNHHRRRHHRAVEPRHRVDGHGRSEHLPELAGRRRASTSRSTRARRGSTWDSPTPTRSRASSFTRPTRTSSTWPLRATSGPTTPSAASTRRPTAERRGRRSCSSTRRPAPSTSSWTRPIRTRCTRPRGSAFG